MSEESELEASVGDKKVKIRGSDILTSIIGMIVCSGIVLVAYILFDHKHDARETASLMVTAVKELSTYQKEGVKEQRVMNCLLSVDQKDRKEQLSVCERLAR